MGLPRLPALVVLFATGLAAGCRDPRAGSLPANAADAAIDKLSDGASMSGSGGKPGSGGSGNGTGGGGGSDGSGGSGGS